MKQLQLTFQNLIMARITTTEVLGRIKNPNNATKALCTVHPTTYSIRGGGDWDVLYHPPAWNR